MAVGLTVGAESAVELGAAVGVALAAGEDTAGVGATAGAGDAQPVRMSRADAVATMTAEARMVSPSTNARRGACLA